MAVGMASLHGLRIKASVHKVLEKLRTNRDQHTKIAAEAKAGYAAKCIEVLEAKIADIKSKKTFNERISFTIPTPVDHTKSYDIAIQMLELAVDPEIELDPEQVRNFYMDEWDWKDDFIESSKMYSATARSYQ